MSRTHQPEQQTGEKGEEKSESFSALSCSRPGSARLDCSVVFDEELEMEDKLQILAECEQEQGGQAGRQENLVVPIHLTNDYGGEKACLS